jgi:hypothetical protein
MTLVKLRLNLKIKDLAFLMPLFVNTTKSHQGLSQQPSGLEPGQSNYGFFVSGVFGNHQDGFSDHSRSLETSMLQ